MQLSLVLLFLATVALATAQSNEINFVFAGLIPSSSSSSGGASSVNLQITEHTGVNNWAGFSATPDGTHVGDLNTYNNTVTDSNGNVVGNTLGTCVTLLAGGAGYCTWSVNWPNGDSLVIYQTLSNINTAGSTGAITGGTGQYQNAGGQCVIGNVAGSSFPYNCTIFLNA